ncbi:MAG: 3-keto-disaccharide hydrolase, partial [Janthinobacterium lividum]
MTHARHTSLLACTTLALLSSFALAQQPAPQAGAAKPTHEDTEFYKPVPPVVTPAATLAQAPSDAVVLFDGKDLSQWVSAKDKSPADWNVTDGVMTVKKGGGGNIETKQAFKDYQLHLEWKIPASITGEGQGRGNSGVFLASTGTGDAGYELQIMDSYNNPTYTNGMLGSLYKQAVPLANAARKPGEWSSYDIVWTAPRFNGDGTVKTPAFATVLLNGVLVENHFALKGQTLYVGQPFYQAYDTAPIKLQAHGDKSEPISFRNIWIRSV